MMTTIEYESSVDTDQENKRSQKREPLIYYLRVHQYATKEYFGRVVDMSRQGIMLVLNEHVDPELLFDIVVEMPEGFSSSGELQLIVVSKWCNQDVNVDYFIAGFAFQEISSDTRSSISRLLNLYSLSRSIKGF